MDGFRRIWKVLMLPLCALLFSCEKNKEEDDGRVKVVATIAMIGDVAEAIGGDLVKVETLIGPGLDPHLYKTTSSDIKALGKADLIFYNGLYLEGKMAATLEKFGKQNGNVHAVTKALEGGYLMEDGEHSDPHVWMDVEAWKKSAGVILEVFQKHDPDNKEAYQARHDEYVKRMDGLHAYAKKCLASIPENQRVLVTAHDAFGYMARAYGLSVRGVQGISTESEAGLKDIESLVSYLVDNQIPSVFVESSVSRKNIQALIEGAAARGHEVVVGGELFSDAMGKKGTYEGTYIGMIDHNVTTITRALGGEAPEKGWQGKLSHD